MKKKMELTNKNHFAFKSKKAQLKFRTCIRFGVLSKYQKERRKRKAVQVDKKC